ncbi:hypothetical protein JCM16138_19030 [Thermococcus atlanticus]
MKWKPLFAVLLGLLMVGVTAGSASAGLSNLPSGKVGHVALNGVYDPTPKNGNGVTYGASGKLEFDLNNHRLYGWIAYNGRRVPIFWRYNVIKSTDFDGYAMFPASSRAGRLNVLELVVYANGTVWLFARDSNGGLVALKGISRELINALNCAQVSTSSVSDKEWLWMIFTPHVEKREIPVPPISLHPDRVGTMSAPETSTSQETFEYIYTVGWWIFKSTLYIDVALELHGPTILKDNGMYGFDIRILDEGEISNGQKHSKFTPLFVGDDGTSLTEPVEVGIVVPHASSLSLEIQKIFFDYVGDVVPSLGKIGLGWDILTAPFDGSGINPINAVSLFTSTEPKVLYDKFPPAHPPNVLHAAYRNIRISSKSQWLGGDVYVQRAGGSGLGAIRVYFKAPVYYRISVTQSGGFKRVGLLQDSVSLSVFNP